MPDADLIFLRALQAQRKKSRQQTTKKTLSKRLHTPNFSPSQRRGFAQETIALDYLISQGLRCIARNYQNLHDEIDLIMSDGQHIIFVEVRSRQKNYFGCALESINLSKQKKLIRAANRYLQQTKLQNACRFDVIAIDQGKIKRIISALQPRFNMTLTTRVTQHFTDAIALFEQSAELLAPLTSQAIHVLFNTLVNDGKILACGNGGSAADAQHFVGELVGRFEYDRIPLAAIALTADVVTLTAVANDFGYTQVFAQQVNALGQAGDALVAISTSGNSDNVIQAIIAAKNRDMPVIALTGKGGGKITELLGDEDIHLCVPHNRTLRIQEVHMMLLHAICDGIDAQLLGEV